MKTRSQTRADNATKSAFSSESTPSCDIAVPSKKCDAVSLLDDPKVEVECCICYEVPSPQDLSTICGCNHKFCFGCIDTWARIKNSCPLCNGTFTKINRGPKIGGKTKTYRKKRRNPEANIGDSFASIRARLEHNGLQQSQVQRQIDLTTQYRDRLRREADEIRSRIDFERLMVESMQRRIREQILQRAEVEHQIAALRWQISQIDNYIASRRNIYYGY